MNWLALSDFVSREKIAEAKEWERLKGKSLAELVQAGEVAAGKIDGDVFASSDKKLPVRAREDDRIQLLPYRTQGTLGQALKAAGHNAVSADVEEVLGQNVFLLRPFNGRLNSGPTLMVPGGPLEEGYQNTLDVLERCEAGESPSFAKLLEAQPRTKQARLCTNDELFDTFSDAGQRKPDGLSIVQGPPGSGKTHLIGRLVAHWAKQGLSVLVAAFTNRAVDEVLRKTVAANPAGAPVLARVG